MPLQPRARNMKRELSAADIVKRTREAKKTYSFQNDRDPSIPVECWFQNPMDGLTLFIVFYTQACRWAQCLGCNLPSKESKNPIDFHDLIRQVDYVFGTILTREQQRNLRKIIISNNGSVLDEVTFSTTALIYFIAKMKFFCPNVSILSLETRPEYVDMIELSVLSRAMQEGETPTTLELAVGFEAFDETIRNEYFKKGLSLIVFEEMARMVAQHGFKLKVYYMLKPVPQLSEIQAIEDVQNGIEYLDRVSKQYNVDINLHLNPTFVASGTVLEEEYRIGRYTPPSLESVRQAVLPAEGKNLSVFIGLYDEGLAVPGGSCIREGDEDLVIKMNLFNQHQDYALLKGT
ncbi:hypothetical protein ACFL27_00850 [candidate division CSSED10-310 bacterium]|uniref:Elp3/MiaA/NifB-like radical SAM core domain-containing protein n=1 Tax=candidate division CSSED10-310 bacterium TaxID=2855610 RepID=A0ABV6YR88_UNCC1